MNHSQFDFILAQGESQNIDFKADCPWDVKKFAKDILAMSNLKDGGSLIIGIENETWNRKGISEENAATFMIDEMKDSMTKYADPNVDFKASSYTDPNGLNYMIIQVLPFKYIPVICRKDDATANLQAGSLYYRNSNRRPESARVSNSNDMRDIIEMAAARMMQRKIELGFSIDNSSYLNKFKEEREGL